jgi:hypothetical protein
MRFISKAGAFTRSVVKAETQMVGGVQVETTKPLVAMFQRNAATDADRQLAQERFGFKPKDHPMGPDPLANVSVYDTDAEALANEWSHELKNEVEQALLQGQNAYYFLAGKEPAAKPWATYDETEAESIVGTAVMIGKPLEDVLAYERENENRPKVVEAIEAKLAEAEIVVAA